MELNIAKEVAVLRRMTVQQLRARYAEVFGEPTNGNHKVWLTRRIAWRLQALAEGDLSERARRRAAKLANDADIRMNPPNMDPATPAPERTQTRTLRFQQDDRLPPPGTILTRKYKGQTLQVQILAEGFNFEGQVYGSLSAVAKAITGSHCNGFLFFHLTANGGNP
jgi:hypothetical protein